MSTSSILISTIVYILFLFLIAFIANKKAIQGKSIVNNPYTYALSLAVYCTAWTYYGSVGLAASVGGLSFLCIYIGPILTAPLWMIFLRKMILISKLQRITSIADFISSRYGKSTILGVITTLVAVFGIIPYIALQLKAVDASFSMLASEDDWLGLFLDDSTFFKNKSFIIALILTIFTLLFGTRHLDPNERHDGMVAAIAFESIWKLVAFLSIGIFITYGIYDGFSDIFQKATQQENIARLFSMKDAGVDSWTWSWMVLLSMSAVILLPRQFHVLVVENTNVKFVEKAAWLFPLYLLLINIFVLPIAFGGMLHFPDGQVEPDNFVLSLPLLYGKQFLALFVYLGGLSAATAMVIVAVTALSIMISNNLVLPIMLQSSLVKEDTRSDLSRYLLSIRRVSIIVVMLLAYTYFKAVGSGFSLVSIGLISFSAIAQFLPSVIGGLYWKRATEKAAISSLLVGIGIWALTLTLPTLAEVGVLSRSIIENGYFGLDLLKPYALFGMEEGSIIAHSAFWSLLLNTVVYIVVSLNTIPKPSELTQADLFIDIEKYTNDNSIEVVKRAAKFEDIELLLRRFLGKKTVKKILKKFAKERSIDIQNITIADAEIINFAETQLAGSIGAASAKIVLESVVKEESISLEEILQILDKTQEAIQYSKALEKKSKELEDTTHQLKSANEQLQELDHLKADFITTVTHELRTPITSIKSLSKILYDDDNIASDKKEKFLEIIVDESERITRLINQVLDIEKIQANHVDTPMEQIDFNQLAQKACKGLLEVFHQNNISYKPTFPKEAIKINGNHDLLTQVIVNLLSNAIKFCDEEKGIIEVSLLLTKDKQAVLKVKDNGIGIASKHQKVIFDKFTQVSSQKTGKPKGSGLGLSISKEIIKQHGGEISVKSTEGKGATFIIKIPTN